ncbi:MULTISPECIES: SymE family type I addiction module toxin [unclassified Gilliamella]|uniref:SymE family type I addiction module toxin n=1 Tax=unclassified Gilliamella TaxID=2685620 RepID=UPI00226AB837|nr:MULTISPECIES: SymE family type I addiction module toxin [unclassified Gilliamella]MCX8582408.1 type I toxin-antitoxin system SymE family toxin [Gilliamella sp. B3372]MCX8595716.1 type I toxin-antitoxin system SymE family toxin [Gilliamella sp. B3367]
MAKTHSKLKSATGKELASQPNERFYTVGYVPQGTKPNPKPQLTIKGRWLEQIGYYVGCPVIINIEQGKFCQSLILKLNIKDL